MFLEKQHRKTHTLKDTSFIVSLGFAVQKKLEQLGESDEYVSLRVTYVG